MKAELELTLNRDGNPCIKITHHDRDKSLEQLTLKLLINQMLTSGIKINNTSGYLETGTNNSFEIYEISAI